MLFSHLCLGPPSSTFISDLPTKILAGGLIISNKLQYSTGCVFEPGRYQSFRKKSIKVCQCNGTQSVKACQYNYNQSVKVCHYNDNKSVEACQYNDNQSIKVCQYNDNQSIKVC
jgi:hypothetical protein